MTKLLTQDDIERAARDLGVPTAAIHAVKEVESAGHGFYDDGTPLILFERHIMYRQVREKFNRNAADRFAGMYPDIINVSPGGYGKSKEQPGRMDRAAKQIDRECALQSASWGLFQIMGYHWKALGYESLQAFVNAMYRSEGDQLDAFVRFIKENENIHRALKALDWAGFAKGYNGSNYRINQYDTKLAAAYARHRTA